DDKVRTLWLNDVAILPRPAEAAGAEVTATIRLDEIAEGEHDWRFSRGEEFPGAKGSFTIVKDQPAAGQSCLKRAGDFTAGGGEHWGGANDGKWHGPAKQFVISLSDKSDEKNKQPTVYLADIRAEVLLPVFVQPAAFKSDFEGAEKLGDGWTVKGDASIDATT